MRELSELDINERGKRISRARPRAVAITSFERQFGLVLPEEYLALLNHSNGGHPKLNSIVSAISSTRCSVSRFYHLDQDKTSPLSLWAAMETWRQILGPRRLPFATDGGGNQFVLDLNVRPGSVKLCVHDEGFRMLDVAPSFETFIDLLSCDPEMT